MADKVSPIEALPPASRAYGEIGPVSAQPRWGMVVDQERCIGCWSCCVICKSENDVPLGMWWNRIDTVGDALDTPARASTASWRCTGCRSPASTARTRPAPRSARSQATYPREDGVVMQDYAALHRLPLLHGRLPLRRARVQLGRARAAHRLRHRHGAAAAHRAPWRSARSACTGSPRGRCPSCVWSCPAQARIFGDLNDPDSRVSRAHPRPRAATSSSRSAAPTRASTTCRRGAREDWSRERRSSTAAPRPRPGGAASAPRPASSGSACSSLGLAVGLGAWVYQLANGLAVTNMRNPMMWGLYITLFMYFVGLSAGGLIVASAGRLFGATRLKPDRPPGRARGHGGGHAGGAAAPPRHRPARTASGTCSATRNFTSPLIWDITIVTIYFLISAIYVWVYTRADLAARGSWLALGTGTSARRRAPRRADEVGAGGGRPAGRDPAPLDHGLDLRPADRPRLLVHGDHGAAVHHLGARLGHRARDPARARRPARAAGSSFRDDLVAYLGGMLAVFVAVEAFLVFCRDAHGRLSGRGLRGRPRRAGCSPGRYARSSGSRSWSAWWCRSCCWSSRAGG